MLIVEILLTAAAWRKGWGWLSLLPLVFSLCSAFVIGLVAGVSGGVLIVFDLIVICVLMGMAVSPREHPRVLPLPAEAPASDVQSDERSV